jgi:hypothetical protein
MYPLTSWTDDPSTAHFSGSGEYGITFHCPVDYLSPEIHLMLDLGVVGSIAQVELNGKKVGTAWMQPYHLDITGMVSSGDNHLTVTVTNELINYVAGLTPPPPVPPGILLHYGSQAASQNDDKSLTREFGYRPLPSSGLLGPVRILAGRCVRLVPKPNS